MNIDINLNIIDWEFRIDRHLCMQISRLINEKKSHYHKSPTSFTAK
jgi:hypothetical protein